MTILARLISFFECEDFLQKPNEKTKVMYSQDFIEIMLNRNIR